MNRIPTLDGWRGMAIAFVLFDHVQPMLLNRYLQPWTQTGPHGVTIFFVLSGFLITTKLMEGPIDLKRFYTRRFFRLMPAAWTYLAFVLLLSIFIGAPFTTPAGVLACILLFQNYVGNWIEPATFHFWSLSLEEQFYLLWPCVLLLAGIRRGLWIAAAGALACAAFRLVFWASYNHTPANLQSQVRADALLAGCILAILLANERYRALATRWSGLMALPALAAALFAITHFRWLPPLFESVSIAILIASTSLHRGAWYARPFSFAPLAWLGTISYSVYLWQQFFALLHSAWAFGILMPMFALASYYWIEKPFTRLGHRLTRSAAPERVTDDTCITPSVDWQALAPNDIGKAP